MALKLFYLKFMSVNVLNKRRKSVRIITKCSQFQITHNAILDYYSVNICIRGALVQFQYKT